jgi:hypothetical protein
MSEPTPSPFSFDRETTRRGLIAIGGALVVMAVLIWAFFYYGEAALVHTGQVDSLTVYPIHHELANKGNPQRGVNGGTEQYNELIVLAGVSVTNTSKKPLTLLDMQANVLLPGNKAINSLAASTPDIPRIFEAYPGLDALRAHPLLRDTVIAPGQTVEGQLIFNYPLTKQQWEARQGLDVTIQFVQQTSDLHINLKGNATVGRS